MTRKYDCPDMMDLIVDYLEGDLDDEKRQHLERHFDGCPPCQNYLETYRQTGELCREALKKEMPSELKSRLRGFLAKECNCGAPGETEGTGD